MKSCMPEYPCEICYENEHDGSVRIKTLYKGSYTGIETYVCNDCLDALKFDVVEEWYSSEENGND